MKLGHLLEGNEQSLWRTFLGNIYWNNNGSLRGATKHVSVSFYCDNNELTSLEGAPEKVGGEFNCSSNRLTSLKGAPKEVGKSFYCTRNQLTSLEGAPEKVGGGFSCSSNRLTSLKGVPKDLGGGFACDYNQLTSLEGAPEKVWGFFECHYNRLTSLEGIHKQIKRIEGRFYAKNNQIESHVLGLLLIDGITEIELDNEEVAKILNKHLKNTNKRQRVALAQRELIEADLDEFAEL